MSPISARLTAGEDLAVAAHSLVEAYSVLTRLPPPHRLSAKDASTLVHSNFAEGATVIALAAADYQRLIATAPAAGVTGGRTYDAVIVESAHKGKASEILTLNDKDFAGLVREGTEIVNPSA
jgi:predicted nucleic acid-binding protein